MKLIEERLRARATKLTITANRKNNFFINRFEPTI
jgi:hypothetical protein